MPISLFFIENDRIIARSVEEAAIDINHLLWCDLLNPTREQELLLESQLGIEIPTRDEMHEIEISSRLYVENDAAYCIANLATKLNSPEPEIHAVTFILKDTAAITLRYCEPHSFKIYADHLLSEKSHPANGSEILMGLLEAMVNRIADSLESSNIALDGLHRQLFRPSIQDKIQRKKSMPDFEELLRQIGIQGDLLSKLHESLLSMTRMLGFIPTTSYCSPTSETYKQSQILIKDISALNEHGQFLSNKVTFLLEASLGLVGVQQTMIIKIFSVAAVVFLPPTLVASIYGMNFTFMPELSWKFGYPMAILSMVCSAWLPYQFFKKKKWL